MLRTTFRLAVPASHPLTAIRAPGPLFEGVLEILRHYSIARAGTTDAYRRGSSIFFTVQSHIAADRIVRNRCHLKESGITILDVLSARDQQRHDALVPLFEDAIAKGQRAQFTRGNLKIDGQWVE